MLGLYQTYKKLKRSLIIIIQNFPVGESTISLNPYDHPVGDSNKEGMTLVRHILNHKESKRAICKEYESLLCSDTECVLIILCMISVN